MTDVRSLLRNERASRRVYHPNALYTPTGSLECNVCRIPLKNDSSEWNKHLKSTQHAMRAERFRLVEGRPQKSPQDAILTEQRQISGIKKRKLDDEEDDSRKKTRPLISPPPNASTEAQTQSLVSGPANESVNPLPLEKIRTGMVEPPADTVPQIIDEDEWAAFERDVATPPPETRPIVSGVSAQATISAAPVSAAELAAQEKQKERESGKERREAEMEAEKEDAARAIEEEFDEMEGLEQRLSKLKERREALRLATADDDGENLAAGAAGATTGGTNNVSKDLGDESEEDEDDNEGWGLGW